MRCLAEKDFIQNKMVKETKFVLFGENSLKIRYKYDKSL